MKAFLESLQRAKLLFVSIGSYVGKHVWGILSVVLAVLGLFLLIPPSKEIGYRLLHEPEVVFDGENYPSLKLLRKMPKGTSVSADSAFAIAGDSWRICTGNVYALTMEIINTGRAPLRYDPSLRVGNVSHVSIELSSEVKVQRASKVEAGKSVHGDQSGFRVPESPKSWSKSHVPCEWKVLKKGESRIVRVVYVPRKGNSTPDPKAKLVADIVQGKVKEFPTVHAGPVKEATKWLKLLLLSIFLVFRSFVRIHSARRAVRWGREAMEQVVFPEGLLPSFWQHVRQNIWREVVVFGILTLAAYLL
jgi:hypothetical protein